VLDTLLSHAVELAVMATDATTQSPTEPRFEETQSLLVVLRLATRVHEDGVHVRLSPVPLTGRHVDFADVERVEVATYRAGEHGGYHWGLRVGPGGDAVYRAGGAQGVRLHLTDDRTLFVGSRRPGELRDAVAAGLPDG
jgi:hypothetical protein